jgi:hypothetical protein
MALFYTIEPRYAALFYTNATRILILYKNRIRIKDLAVYKCNEDTGPCSIQMDPGYRSLLYANGAWIQGLVINK